MTALSHLTAGPDKARRLCVFNGGFVFQERLRRILALSGYKVTLGMPAAGDFVAVWGNAPTAHRGMRIAAKRSAQLLRVEDAFLRSVLPGRRQICATGAVARYPRGTF